MKTCSICNRDRLNRAFGVGRGQCNACRAKLESRRYNKNRTAIRNQLRERWRSDPNYRNRLKALAKVYGATRRDKKKTYDVAYRSKNQARITVRGRQYYERNKEKIRPYLNNWQNNYRKTPRGRISMRLANHRRRERIRNTSDGSVTAVALLQLWKKQDAKCAICVKPMQLKLAHIDHATPLVRGGRHTLTNIQWTCAGCNLSKHTN